MIKKWQIPVLIFFSLFIFFFFNYIFVSFFFYVKIKRDLKDVSLFRLK